MLLLYIVKSLQFFHISCKYCWYWGCKLWTITAINCINSSLEEWAEGGVKMVFYYASLLVAWNTRSLCKTWQLFPLRCPSSYHHDCYINHQCCNSRNKGAGTLELVNRSILCIFSYYAKLLMNKEIISADNNNRQK